MRFNVKVPELGI